MIIDEMGIRLIDDSDVAEFTAKNGKKAPAVPTPPSAEPVKAPVIPTFSSALSASAKNRRSQARLR